MFFVHTHNVQTIQNQRHIQAVWETGIPVWASKLCGPNNTFQVLFFQLYFNNKHNEVAINDFTMHLIILELLRRKENADRTEKE